MRNVVGATQETPCGASIIGKPMCSSRQNMLWYKIWLIDKAPLSKRFKGDQKQNREL